jgi:hypothetical protein
VSQSLPPLSLETVAILPKQVGGVGHEQPLELDELDPELDDELDELDELDDDELDDELEEPLSGGRQCSKQSDSVVYGPWLSGIQTKPVQRQCGCCLQVSQSGKALEAVVTRAPFGMCCAGLFGFST